ncbi:hypothetical protein ACFZCY_26830 [Streptomyces sp. NPDC007983]|uniref:hypothetical protein n=1 Tax=Streptomyces sp. NPDC007983 TaxID=3364800 RepID=UPI0036EF48D5
MSKSHLKVVTDAIRSEARMWDRQAKAIGEVGTTIKGLRPGLVEWGMFTPLVSAYTGAIDHLADRCSEGKNRMTEIADALVENAKAYDNHEAETKKSVEGAY